jgi:hypothetical protein
MSFDERNTYLEDAGNPARMLEAYRIMYESTGDPTTPLAALCASVDLAGDSGTVTIPAWAAHHLAAGFHKYLETVATGTRKVSLEKCLGIDSDVKDAVAELTNKDSMVEDVFMLRWMFGLPGPRCCEIVYRWRMDQCSGLGLKPERVGITQNPAVFIQYYHRNATAYETWRDARESRDGSPTLDQVRRFVDMQPEGSETVKLKKRIAYLESTT